MGRFGDSRAIFKHCENLRSQMWTEFESVRPRLVEIARYVYPLALRGLTQDVKQLTPGEEYDADDAQRLTFVPFDAFRICHSGFYTNLTNPSTNWFRLRTPSFDGLEPSSEDFEAKELERITVATRKLMDWCGAYRMLHAIYKHLAAFGFAAGLCEPDDERFVRCQALRPGTYALGIDRTGRVCRVIRHFAFSAEQMADEYGAENCGQHVRNAIERDDFATRFEVWNLIEPHKAYSGVQSPFTLSASEFGHRSIHWSAELRDAGENGILAVRGYRVNPLLAPRLNFEPGDTYGRGCASDIIGQCRALQLMAEIEGDIADQEAHPSMMAPASMMDDGLRLGPLEVNYYPDNLGPNAVYRTIAPGHGKRGEQVAAEMLRLETEIRKAFFNTEFETISAMEDNSAMAGQGQASGKMTATEVKARVSEKMEQLSGIATTLNDELLDPFVTTMAHLAIDRGLVAPEIPTGVWDIKYESAIHAAANAQPVNAALDSLNYTASLAQAIGDPAVCDNIDADAMSRDIHRRLGAPEKYLRDSEIVAQIRAERDAQLQAQQDAERDAINAKALKDAMSAPVSPETIGGQLAAQPQI